MFGGFHSTARNSSVRSGAADLPEHDEEEELAEHVNERRGPSSSEEAEERRRGRDGRNSIWPKLWNCRIVLAQWRGMGLGM